ncbi:MAG: hypothetical protein HFH36_13650 [Lachnospiraceae bacterium]|nr:hypothetical protein [Lachnospiraceae bacterium]
MQKSKGMKMAALLCGAVVAIGGIVLVASHFMKGQELYRSILIYEMEGTANIEREDAGNIKAAENLYLESGDRLTVEDGSSMRLKLDDDKYAMVEENSILAIEAAGNAKDSKTKIELVQGAITNEIQNPLSSDSTYEVNSPNSVMAVRGTIFRVEVTDSEGEECDTKVSVFSGKVSMSPILEDGTVGDEILIAAGEEAECVGDSVSGPVLTDPAEIDFQSLPLQALDFLLELAEREAPVTGISKEELSGLIQETEDWEDGAASGDAETEDSADLYEDTEENDTDGLESEEPESGMESENQSGSAGNSGSQTAYSGSTGTASGNGYTRTPGNTNNNHSGTTSGINPGTTPGSNPGTTPGGNLGTTPGTNPGTTPGTNPGTAPGTTPGSNPGVGQAKEYTVTFIYQGEVFATQTVKGGKQAQKPILKPEKSGHWDFDFSDKIQKNTTIMWK